MREPFPPAPPCDPANARLSLSPRDPGFVQNPYAAYARLHADDPVFYWQDLDLWCVASFDGVGSLLRDRRLGRERPGGYRASVGSRPHLADFDRVEACSMLELEPPAHSRLRRLVNRAFVSRQIERLRPRIEAIAQRLMDDFPAAPFDLIAAFAGPLPALVIAEMMGLPKEDAPRLVAWSHAMVRMYVPAPTADDERRANAAAAEFAAYVSAEAAARRRGPQRNDLLDILVAAQADGDRLSDEELVSSAILLLNAGHEATVHQIGNAVAALLAQGGDPRRFFATPEATEATVEECLRFDAPLHLFTRWAYEPVEIAPGNLITAGHQVGLLLGAANRDPRAVRDPDLFDPGRMDRKNVSFGAGIHFCIGAPLARLELQVALKVLFDRMPQLALAEPPRWRDSWHFRGLERLVVAF